MAKIKEIRNRIKSVSATHKITRTMEMVAAGRMKRAMDRMIEARPFIKGFTEVVNELIAGEAMDHPMLQARSEVKREAIVVFSSNRGLCGAFNTHLFREGVNEITRAQNAGREVEVHTIGKKVTNLLRFAGYEVHTAHEMPDRPMFDDAVKLTDALLARFQAPEADRVDKVTVVSAKYENALRQPPHAQQALPLVPDKAEDGAPAERPGTTIYSPDREQIVSTLLPLFLRSAVFQAYLETTCSEQVARRNAMKNATENAEEMIKTLTRNLNKARQAQITAELAEIVGGAQALG